ncbi:UMP kinase [Thermostilla marina]
MSDGQTQAVSPYKRIILKVSGEAFTQDGRRGITMASVVSLAEQTARAARLGAKIAIVLGGGNILRGAQFTAGNSSVQERTAHYMGMLATVMNGLALQDALESLGCDTRLASSIRIEAVAEPYVVRRVLRHWEKGRIVILSAGTGRPFVTTDTAAAQAAQELGADIVMKATRVDGVYSDDPEKNPHAVLYSELSYDDVIHQKLRVMDPEAVTKCAQSKLPILVFNFQKEGNIERAVRGERLGTLIREPQE